MGRGEGGEAAGGGWGFPAVFGEGVGGCGGGSIQTFFAEPDGIGQAGCQGSRQKIFKIVAIS